MDESDPYEQFEPGDDAPELDEPENRLHINELHPLIAEAVREPWRARDFHEAVIAAWTALRDRLRERLGSNADGMDLIEEIYGAREGRREGEPRLPLTDFDSETTRSMHHGLVNLLRGIVLYVRNPEQHDQSFVASDKEAAFERLALLSLCARHVDARTESISVEDALGELGQERFADTLDARAELIDAVPAARHAAFASALAAAAAIAVEELDTQLTSRCRTVYRQLSQRVSAAGRTHVLVQMAREVDRLVSRDETLDAAIPLVTPPLYERLATRNQRKVAARILDDVAAGARTTGPRAGVFHRDASRIFPSLSREDRDHFIRLTEAALRDDDSQRRTYGTWLVAWTSRHLDVAEMERLTEAVAVAVAAGHADVVSELERRMRGGTPYRFRTALRAQLQAVRPRTLEGKAQVAEALELIPQPVLRVRRVRSAAERPMR